MNILILDDDKNVGDILKDLVISMGNTAESFTTVEGAIHYFVNNKIDGAIVDYYLNDSNFNGSKFINFLNEKKKIPCMIVTGKVDTSDIEKNYECLIDKAFIMDRLGDCMKKMNDKNV